jgi:hypothetical protein
LDIAFPLDLMNPEHTKDEHAAGFPTSPGEFSTNDGAGRSTPRLCEPQAKQSSRQSVSRWIASLRSR